MSRPIILKSTLDAINRIHFSLFHQRDKLDFPYHFFNYWRSIDEPSLDDVRHMLIHLDSILAKNEIRTLPRHRENDTSTDWIFYADEQDVIPVYDEAIAVVSRQLIISAPEIPHVLRFLNIPKTKDGIDVDNHDGKGYHFHYGKVKKDALKRYNVLLTFDKNDIMPSGEQIPNIPLHIEPHGVHKYLKIDASTIGDHRRYPIYLVCLKEMESRGLENFLSPSKDSQPFYPKA